MKKLGLIAGYGEFPLLVAQNAQKAGVKTYVIAVKEEASPEIERYADKIKWARRRKCLMPHKKKLRPS